MLSLQIFFMTKITQVQCIYSENGFLPKSMLVLRMMPQAAARGRRLVGGSPDEKGIEEFVVKSRVVSLSESIAPFNGVLRERFASLGKKYNCHTQGCESPRFREGCHARLIAVTLSRCPVTTSPALRHVRTDKTFGGGGGNSPCVRYEARRPVRAASHAAFVGRLFRGRSGESNDN